MKEVDKLYYLAANNKGANAQSDLRLRCSHRL